MHNTAIEFNDGFVSKLRQITPRFMPDIAKPSFKLKMEEYRKSQKKKGSVLEMTNGELKIKGTGMSLTQLLVYVADSLDEEGELGARLKANNNTPEKLASGLMELAILVEDLFGAVDTESLPPVPEVTEEQKPAEYTDYTRVFNYCSTVSQARGYAGLIAMYLDAVQPQLYDAFDQKRRGEAYILPEALANLTRKELWHLEKLVNKARSRNQTMGTVYLEEFRMSPTKQRTCYRAGQVMYGKLSREAHVNPFTHVAKIAVTEPTLP